MKNIYLYKGQDITLDILMKIEHVVRILSETTNKAFDDCLYDFYQSKVYEALRKTNSLMWSESAEFIVDEYYREKTTIL